MPKVIARLLSLCLIILEVTSCSATKQKVSMKDQFNAYVQALNNHEIDRIMSFLSDDFQLHFTEYDMAIGKEAMGDVLGWDKGVNGSVSCDQWQIEEDSVKTIFTERNEFLRLIGIIALRAEITYRFDNSGLISTQIYRLLPGQPSFQKELEPALEWARKHRSGELAEVYPQNQIQFNEEMGMKWVALLKEWRRDTQVE